MFYINSHMVLLKVRNFAAKSAAIDRDWWAIFLTNFQQTKTILTIWNVLQTS